MSSAVAHAVEQLSPFGHAWMAAWPHSEVTIDGDRVHFAQPRCRLDAFGHRVHLPGLPTAADTEAAWHAWCERHRHHQVSTCVLTWHVDHDTALPLAPRGWRLRPMMALYLAALPDPAPLRLRVLPLRGDEDGVVGLHEVARVARGLPRGPAADLLRFRWLEQDHEDAYYVVSAPHYRVSAAAVVGSDGREGMLVDAFSVPSDRHRRLASYAVTQVLHDYLRTTDGLLWAFIDPSSLAFPWLVRLGFVPSHHVMCLQRDVPWLGPHRLLGMH